MYVSYLENWTFFTWISLCAYINDISLLIGTWYSTFWLPLDVSRSMWHFSWGSAADQHYQCAFQTSSGYIQCQSLHISTAFPEWGTAGFWCWGGITMSHLSLKGLSGSSRKGHLPHLSLVSFNQPRLSSVLMSSYTVLNLYKYVPDFAEWKEWKMDFAFLTLHSLRGQGLLYDLLLVGLLRHIITQGDLDNQCCCILPISVTAVRQSKPRGNCSSR